MFAIIFLIFVCSVLSYSDGAYVDTLSKCSIKDNDCLKATYQKVITDMSKTGIPELNSPPLDPLVLHNINLTLFDTVQVVVTDGVATGIGECIFNNIRLDMEKLMAYQEVTCDIVIEGSVIISGKNAELQAPVGLSGLNGEGDGKLVLDKVNLKFKVPFKVIKKDDGEVYLEVQVDAVKYKYKVGNAKSSAKHISVGGVDVTDIVVSYINGNWREIIKLIGTPFLDVSKKIYFGIANNFFTGVPARKYIIEDLSSYIGK